MRDRRVDLHAFERLIAALLVFDTLDGAHIMQTVGELDDDDTDVVTHRDQHLADVLRLRFFTVGELDLADLGQAVDEVHDLFAEVRIDLFEGDLGVFDRIVQQRRDDRIRIHAHLGEDTGDRSRMQDKGNAGDTALVAVRKVGEFIRLFDLALIIPDVAFVNERQ